MTLPPLTSRLGARLSQAAPVAFALPGPEIGTHFGQHGLHRHDVQPIDAVASTPRMGCSSAARGKAGWLPLGLRRDFFFCAVESGEPSGWLTAAWRSGRADRYFCNCWRSGRFAGDENRKPPPPVAVRTARPLSSRRAGCGESLVRWPECAHPARLPGALDPVPQPESRVRSPVLYSTQITDRIMQVHVHWDQRFLHGLHRTSRLLHLLVPQPPHRAPP